MNPYVIEFAGVSKRYVIRHQKTGYLKDRLTAGLMNLNPFARDERDQTTEEFWALKDVSFAIRPGESVGIVGANGSGKSTTLKILAGITQQTSGRVQVNGKLGALIEVGAGFHPELTGRENIFLNGSILGMKRAEIRKKFDAIVAFAQVEQFIDTPVKHYSSGMYVRLAFSIAIHTEPEILLVDEVLGVGDASFQRKCFDRMQQFRDSGHTFIVISHSMPQIQALCGRVILLNHGRVMADGKPQDVTDLHDKQQTHAATAVPLEPPKSSVIVTSTRLLNQHGSAAGVIESGQPFVIEFDYDTKEPLANALAWVQFMHGTTRVFDTDTRSMEINLGTLHGQGTIRCEIPGLPLMAHTFDVNVGIFDGTVGLLGSASNFGMLELAPPANMFTLERGWDPNKDQRSVFFASTRWQVSQATNSTGPLGGHDSNDDRRFEHNGSD